MKTQQSLPTKPPFPLVTIACLIIIVAGMKMAAPILNPLFLAIFIATMCWPSLTWLGKKGLPSGLAITLIIATLFVVLTMLGAYVGAALNQFSKALPIYQANLLEQTAGLIDTLHGYGFSIPKDNELTKELNAGKVMHFAGSLLTGLGDVFANIFFILLTVIFLLFESYILPQKLHIAFGHSLTNKHSNKIISSLNRYMGIKVITSLVTGVLIALSLYGLGVDFPILWGVMAFMLNFVPNIGSIIAAIPTVLLAWVQLGGNTALLVVACYFSVNMLIGNLWEPKIMGRGLGLSTLVVFLSLTFWGWVFGTVGMLLSVPFTMIAKIILENDEKTRWIAVLLGSADDLKADEKS